MQRLPLDNVICLPLDHVMLGMEYGDVARYVSTCFDVLLPYFHGATAFQRYRGILGNDIENNL